MKVVNIHGVNDVRVDEVAEPSLDAGDVLIKVGACGICGSDLSYIKRGGLSGAGGLPGAAMPMPLGHEAAGVVARVGTAVTDIRLGMRVIINPMGGVGHVIGNGASEGAFSTYLKLRQPRLNQALFLVPEGVSEELAALAEPLAVAFHAVDRGDPKPGEKVAVFGVGPIGLGAVIGLKRRGIDHVVAVDMSPTRLELARHFGASHTILAGSEDVAERLAEYHGSEPGMGKHAVGTDIYIDAAGAPTVIPDIINMTKHHARLVIPALYGKEVSVSFSRMLRSEMSIIMSKGYSSFPPVIEAIADLGDKLLPFISHRFDFEHVLDALQTSDQKTTTAKVMVTFPE